MRKVCGECFTCDKSVARTVHRDRKADITGTPTKVCRVVQHRVKNQWLAAVVGTDVERSAIVSCEDIRGGDLAPFPLYVLVDHRFLELHFATRDAQHEVPVRV